MPVLLASTFVQALWLLIQWYVILLVAFRSTWTILRVVGVAHNRRKATILTVPLIALMLRAVRFDWLLLWIAVPILLVASNGGRIPPPTPDAIRYGQLAFCYGFLVIAALVIPRGLVARIVTGPHDANRQDRSSPADAIRHWSAEGDHPIEDLTAEDGLTPLPIWAPGAKAISDDGLVAEERVLHPALTMVP